MKRTRPLALTVALALMLLPSGVAAQDDEAGHDASAAKAALEGLIPTQLGGQPWQELTVQSGAESQAELDPNDEFDAEQIAETDALLTELGASLTTSPPLRPRGRPRMAGSCS